MVTRFWRKIQKGSKAECWLWLHGTQKGYGAFWIPRLRRMERAHRIAWELTHRRVIPAGISVCHRCDNPLCCNPHHLFLGSHGDNMRDMHSKGRRRTDYGLKGSANPQAKLTEEQVREIRELRAQGVSGIGLAKRFGVTNTKICQIHLRRCWKHI